FLRHKIVLYDGKILDGRNRYRAILHLGWQEDAIAASFSELHEVLGYPVPIAVPKGAAAKYVLSANLHRRHLTTEQKRVGRQAACGHARGVERFNCQDCQG